MGEVNTFTVQDGRIIELDVSIDGVQDGCLVLRPEYLRHLGDEGSADVRFTATIDNDFMLGSRTHFHLGFGDSVLVAELPALLASQLAVGTQQHWGFDLADAVSVAD